MTSRYLAVLAAAGLLSAAPARAQESPTPPQSASPQPAQVDKAAPLNERLRPMLRPGLRAPDLQRQAGALFQMLDSNVDGIVSKADIEERKAAFAINGRIGIMMPYFRLDLDGDGVITRDEVVAGERIADRRLDQLAGANPYAAAHRKPMDERVAEKMAADANGDGRIDLAELYAFARRKAATPNDTVWEQTSRVVFAADADGDGSVTRAEFDKAVEDYFRKIDTDHDGTISADELQQAVNAGAAERRREAERQQQKQREEAQQRMERERRQKEAVERAACALPKASDAARVILLSAYEPDALSTTTIGFQDVAVRTGEIVIEPGAAPLYLVVTSHVPTIWRVTGAVGRVERLVLSSALTGPNRGDANETPLVGATGLAADKVTFAPKPGCFNYFSDSPSIAEARTTAAVRAAAGKEPATVASRYAVASFSVPSGHVAAAGDNNSRQLTIRKSGGSLRLNLGSGGTNILIENGSGNLARDLQRYFPGGVVEIDPASVVASRPAQRYEVLPQQAGLIQLEQSGALTENRIGEFLIHKKIRFPAELYGGYAVKFLLLRGVPAPDGDPGHSCVMSQETGEPLDGNSMCR